MRHSLSSVLFSLAILLACWRSLSLEKLPTLNESNLSLLRPLIIYGVDTRFLYPFGACGLATPSTKPEEKPNAPDANPYLSGLWLIYENQWNASEEAFIQALEMNRTSADAAYALGVARALRGDLEGAYHAWQSGRATTRLRLLGRLCAQSGDRQAAERYYLATLQSISKEDQDAYQELVLFFAATTNQEAYQRSLEGFLTLTQPGTLVYNQTMGRVYLFRERYEKAKVLLVQAAHQAPRDGANWYWLGVAATKVGEAQQAKDHFQKAIELSPGNIHAYLRLAETCLLLQDRECARTAYEEALKLDPNNPTAQQGRNALEK